MGKWTVTDYINQETGEMKAHQVDSGYIYGHELIEYNTVVMTSKTKVRITTGDATDIKECACNPFDRIRKFDKDLITLFDSEVKPKCPMRCRCVIHVDITDDYNTAIVSIQDYNDYHFYVKDRKIPLMKI